MVKFVSRNKIIAISFSNLNFYFFIKKILNLKSIQFYPRQLILLLPSLSCPSLNVIRCIKVLFEAAERSRGVAAELIIAASQMLVISGLKMFFHAVFVSYTTRRAKRKFFLRA